MTERPAGRSRADAERLADHAAIDRLADDLVPALVAKLAASGLGEIEIREGDWHVRVRMPAADFAPAPTRRAGGATRPTAMGQGPATGPGTDVAGQAAAAHAAEEETWERPTTAAGARSSGGDSDRTPGDREPRPRAVATSPAVGIYRARQGVVAGTRVRSGDRLGVVDVLGVPHDVLSPADGVVGATYVGSGAGVEYGQELVRIELADGPGRSALETDPAVAPPAGGPTGGSETAG